MSKGTWQRPAAVADEIIESNWQRIFGKKLDENHRGKGSKSRGQQ